MRNASLCLFFTQGATSESPQAGAFVTGRYEGQFWALKLAIWCCFWVRNVLLVYFFWVESQGSRRERTAGNTSAFAGYRILNFMRTKRTFFGFRPTMLAKHVKVPLLVPQGSVLLPTHALAVIATK